MGLQIYDFRYGFCPEFIAITKLGGLSDIYSASLPPSLVVDLLHRYLLHMGKLSPRKFKLLVQHCVAMDVQVSLFLLFLPNYLLLKILLLIQPVFCFVFFLTIVKPVTLYSTFPSPFQTDILNEKDEIVNNQYGKVKQELGTKRLC